MTEPRILFGPDHTLVLCESVRQNLRLRHLHTGDSLELSGVFADRLAAHLSDPVENPFPQLGPIVRQHSWLLRLDSRHNQSPAELLLGSGLGMLFIELTDRCNESCIHCYAESSPERSASLTRDEIGRVLEEARGLGRPAVQFTGGDPLLHKELAFAVQRARELDFARVEIYTNGLALSQGLLEQLVPHRPAFSFSIYASDSGMHDRITQHPGSLARTLAAMRRVQDAGLDLRVGIILMPENKGTENTTITWLTGELGLAPEQIGIDVVRSTGRGEFMRDYRPDMSRLQRFRHATDLPAEETSTASGPTRNGKLCVGANGSVFPCIFSRRVRLGSIREHSLPAIVASLTDRPLATPSGNRWRHCRESLSCSDCQAIAYLLEDTIPIRLQSEGEAHA